MLFLFTSGSRIQAHRHNECRFQSISAAPPVTPVGTYANALRPTKDMKEKGNWEPGQIYRRLIGTRNARKRNVFPQPQRSVLRQILGIDAKNSLS
ncbi:hypothetical protein FHS27_000417 [Rhodopirellula rubra]|uniref:Uncharacterized protein n=1 Tax=Aporhodopirellula rubra TaxID=980271 RepID=A0A7W5H3Z9_9BACT|nr:hypothetical protein [Aporhodopirellula rubra]